MAKVAFSKLKCKVEEIVKTIEFNGESIEVKQYLPIQEKLSLIGRVAELAHDEDYNFSNPVKANVFMELEMIFAYTNITFTDKQKEDLPKLYDNLRSSDFLAMIIDAIPEVEYKEIQNGVKDTIEAVYKYQNSVLGILDNIRNNYSNTEFDVKSLQKAVEELQDSPIMQEVIPLLGLE